MGSNDMFNIDTDAPTLYQQYETVVPDISTVNITGGSLAVTSINGAVGPVITLSAGSSGFSYTTAASTITLVSPLTAKGDIYTRNASAGTRLGVGTNGQVLTANSAQPTGLEWTTVSGSVADGDYGDITVSSSGSVWTIDNGVVTYAKMQDVSAASRLLGRGSASGSGDVQEITLGTNLTMTGTSLSATGPAGSAAFGLVQMIRQANYSM